MKTWKFNLSKIWLKNNEKIYSHSWRNMFTLNKWVTCENICVSRLKIVSWVVQFLDPAVVGKIYEYNEKLLDKYFSLTFIEGSIRSFVKGASLRASNKYNPIHFEGQFFGIRKKQWWLTFCLKFLALKVMKL